ncbi:MAG: phospholipase D family protein [Actinomycetota bacterium]|nr:phospholipase D family protein [Actinomycetota bacterium]
MSALRVLIDAGADVRGLRGLHAKVFVFGDQRAIVTSANLTEAALARNAEFGCVSDDPAFVSACGAYVTQLHQAAAPVGIDQLGAWEATVKGCLRHRAGRDPIEALADHGAPAPPSPSAATGQLSAAATSGDGWLVESERAFIKFAGRGNLRAVLNVSVIDEIRRSGAHRFCTYPTGGGHPRRVRDGDTMFLSRMTSSPNDMRIIGRAIAVAHDDALDVASAQDIEHRSWLAEYGYLVRVHDGEFIDGALGDGVSLGELMDALGPDAFLSIRQRKHDGETDINVRLALMRKADVLLSAEGFAWLNRRFEDAISNCGSIPRSKIDELT